MLKLASRVMDLVLPPLCLNCQALVGDHGTLCQECWDKISFITDPCCPTCGTGFELDMAHGVQCLPCLENPPPWDRGRAVFRYDGASKGLVMALKHADRTDLAPALATWLVRAAAPLLPEIDMIVPVPLHRWRLFYRRYNQSAMLARFVARQTGKPLALEGLKRIRATRSQGHDSKRQRKRNVAGAFQASPDMKGKSILLIDDVLTTGATLAECTRALKQIGAVRVHILVLGRVPMSL